MLIFNFFKSKLFFVFALNPFARMNLKMTKIIFTTKKNPAKIRILQIWVDSRFKYPERCSLPIEINFSTQENSTFWSDSPLQFIGRIFSKQFSWFRADGIKKIFSIPNLIMKSRQKFKNGVRNISIAISILFSRTKVISIFVIFFDSGFSIWGLGDFFTALAKNFEIFLSLRFILSRIIREINGSRSASKPIKAISPLITEWLILATIKTKKVDSTLRSLLSANLKLVMRDLLRSETEVFRESESAPLDFLSVKSRSKKRLSIGRMVFLVIESDAVRASCSSSRVLFRFDGIRMLFSPIASRPSI